MMTLDEATRVLRSLLTNAATGHVYVGAHGAQYDEGHPPELVEAQRLRLGRLLREGVQTHGLYCCAMGSDEYDDGATVEQALINLGIALPYDSPDYLK